nr:MAG TPA: hypothetical protein [Caudoviricetes sp.]
MKHSESLHALALSVLTVRKIVSNSYSKTTLVLCGKATEGEQQ